MKYVFVLPLITYTADAWMEHFIIEITIILKYIHHTAANESRRI